MCDVSGVGEMAKNGLPKSYIMIIPPEIRREIYKPIQYEGATNPFLDIWGGWLPPVLFPSGVGDNKLPDNRTYASRGIVVKPIIEHVRDNQYLVIVNGKKYPAKLEKMKRNIACFNYSEVEIRNQVECSSDISYMLVVGMENTHPTIAVNSKLDTPPSTRQIDQGLLNAVNSYAKRLTIASEKNDASASMRRRITRMERDVNNTPNIHDSIHLTTIIATSKASQLPVDMVFNFPQSSDTS